MGGLYYNLALRNSDVANKDPKKLYYCVLRNRDVVNQETLANYLGQISEVQSALCLAVLSKLGATITSFLKDGQSVEVPHLSSFNLTVNSSEVKTLDETKASQIKSIDLRFSSKEETDLALSRCTLTRSVLMTSTNGVIKGKDPDGGIIDDPTA